MHVNDDAAPALKREPAATFVAFARTLRAAGMRATPHQVHAAVEAIGWLDVLNREDVYWAGRLALCAEPDDLARYDAAFVAFFGLEEAGPVRRVPIVERVHVTARPDTGADDGQGEDSEDTPDVATASRSEVLRQRDVTTLDSAELAEVRAMLAMLDPAGPVRPGRRRHPAKRGTIDRGRTVRDALKHGGETVRLHHVRPRPRPRRLVLLVDVSGSMQPYADSMLRFAHAAARRRVGTEVFTLGTRLTRVTPYLRHRDADEAMLGMSKAVPDWSGGTRLGEQLRAFLSRWGRRGCARGAVVAVCSDGWERGDTALLGEQVADLHRLAYRVVWVNPHRGAPGYEPLTGGMQAALPHIDALVAGHSLAAFQDLAAELSAAARGGGGGARA